MQRKLLPFMILFAAVLCVLIILPMSWLVYYSFVDRTGSFTLGNFVRRQTTARPIVAPRTGLRRRLAPGLEFIGRAVTVVGVPT